MSNPHILPRYAHGEASLLAITTRPYLTAAPNLVYKYLLSFTAVGPRSAFHLSRNCSIMSEHLPRFLEDGAALRHLRQAWIVDPVLVSKSKSLQIADKISSALASLPALETVVVVFDHAPAVPRCVPLEKMLTQLASREYDYFETFVLQTTSHFFVEEDDLEELRRRFFVVRHEYINTLPAVPVPDYCLEPAASPSPMFPGSLW
ncbi:hypothetical protein C8Q76DRAFT_792392 [Earliella scabrosa]|nr:hypothetical protein C8Q76DRAFT_792392 [Earliella scabrosa]